MSIDIISTNNTLSRLKQVNRKRELANYIAKDTSDDESNYSPAYIVELSEMGKQLQQNHPVTIVHL